MTVYERDSPVFTCTGLYGASSQTAFQLIPAKVTLMNESITRIAKRRDRFSMAFPLLVHSLLLTAGGVNRRQRSGRIVDGSATFMKTDTVTKLLLLSITVLLSLNLLVWNMP